MSMPSLFGAIVRGTRAPQAQPKKTRKCAALGPFTEASPPKLDSYVTIAPEQAVSGGPRSARVQAAASTPALVSAVNGDRATVVYVCELVLTHGFGGNPLRRLQDVSLQCLRPYAGDDAAIARLRKLMLSAMRVATLSTGDSKTLLEVESVTAEPGLVEQANEMPAIEETASETPLIEETRCETASQVAFEYPDWANGEDAGEVFLDRERREEEAMEEFLDMQHTTGEAAGNANAEVVRRRKNVVDICGAAEVARTGLEEKEEIRSWVSGFKGQLGSDNLVGVAEADKSREERNDDIHAKVSGLQCQLSFDKLAGITDADAEKSGEEREEEIRAWVRGFKGKLCSDKLLTQCQAVRAAIPQAEAANVPPKEAAVAASDSPSTPSRRRSLRARKLRRRMSDVKEPWELTRSRSRSPRSTTLLPTRRSRRIEMKERLVGAVAQEQGLAGAIAHALGNRRRMLLSELLIAVHGSDPRGSLREYQPKYLKIMEGIKHLEDTQKIYVADSIIFSLSV